MSQKQLEKHYFGYLFELETLYVRLQPPDGVQVLNEGEFLGLFGVLIQMAGFEELGFIRLRAGVNRSLGDYLGLLRHLYLLHHILALCDFEGAFAIGHS